jgi:hypothetical protein
MNKPRLTGLEFYGGFEQYHVQRTNRLKNAIVPKEIKNIKDMEDTFRTRRIWDSDYHLINLVYGTGILYTSNATFRALSSSLNIPQQEPLKTTGLDITEQLYWGPMSETILGKYDRFGMIGIKALEESDSLLRHFTKKEVLWVPS